MELFYRVDVNILAVIILIILFFKAYNPLEKMFVLQRLFLGMLLLNAIIIAFDTTTWLIDGLPGSPALFWNTATNLILYIIIPIAPSMWILYTEYQINKSEANLKKIFFILSCIVLSNGLLSVVSLWTGWYFLIDGHNIYHRGNTVWIFLILCYSLILYSFFIVLINRNKINKKHYASLLLFFVPFLIGTTLQVLFFGVSYAWTGMMIGMLILYVNIQIDLLNVDYLTGVFNRRQLEGYLLDKVKNNAAKEPFSAILIDLDDFKIINDRYGHPTGDEALKDTVSILRKSLRQHDFIARFGGDEFIIVMDVDNRETLNQAIERILQNAAFFNSETQRPYKLSFAMGYDVYDPHSKMNYDEFIMKIDSLMYLNKKQKKQANIDGFKMPPDKA
jgi:diguanylate cyclase (GGDEF)-like protein